MPRLKVRAGLILLVGLTLITLSVVGFRALSGLTYEDEVVIRDRALSEMGALESNFRNSAAHVVGVGLKAVQEAGAAGAWQFRCLYFGGDCPSDPNGLVAFAAIFDGELDLHLPPSDEFARPVIETEFLKRNGAVLRTLAAAITAHGSTPAQGPGVHTDRLVWAADGLASCRLAPGVAKIAIEPVTLCAVLEVDAFEAVLSGELDRRPFASSSSLRFQIRRSDQKDVWSTDGGRARGDFIASANLRAPFSDYQVIAFQRAESFPSLLPFYGLSLFIILAFGATVGLATFVHREHVAVLNAAEVRANRAAHLSHDLRTPLTNIRLYVSMLDPGDSARDFTKSRDIIVSEIEWLDGLIEHTLAVVRRGSGENPLAYNPDDIVEHTCERFAPLLKNRQSHVTTELTVKRSVPIDRWALEQVLMNLLDNVRNHAPVSHVLVATKLVDDELILSVENEDLQQRTSTKIEIQPRLPMEQRHGLGLKICREIVESGGGRLRTEKTTNGFLAEAFFKVGLPE
ncbi:MAG: HAMP domain-containing sensor histidine kinase [Pseudomonadota bacterium]